MARPSFRVDAVLVQAIIAGALSFAHLHDLADAVGQDGWKAWAYPISVDLLLVAAWRRLRSEGPSRLAWCWFLIALFASLGANVATAGFLDLAHPRPGCASASRDGLPSPSSAARSSPTRTSPRTRNRFSPAPEAEPDIAPEPLPVPAPLPVAEDTPTIASTASTPTGPPVPAALVDHARKLAADHQARTGARIDTDTLRARLGVPPHLADTIAAQLT